MADNTQGKLPSYDDAYNNMFGVYQQVFFDKLAADGIVPANGKQAEELLKLAGKLRVVAEDPRVKQASEADDIFAQANADLDRALAQHGLDGGIKSAAAQEQDVALQKLAQRLAQDPSIYNSALSIKTAEATQIAAALKSQSAAA